MNSFSASKTFLTTFATGPSFVSQYGNIFSPTFCVYFSIFNIYAILPKFTILLNVSNISKMRQYSGVSRQRRLNSLKVRSIMLVVRSDFHSNLG